MTQSTTQEFQWFQMQTRLRQIIQEVFNPLQKSILENKTQLTRIKHKTDQQQKQINSFHQIINNDPQVCPTIDFGQINQQFQTQNQSIAELQCKLKLYSQHSPNSNTIQHSHPQFHKQLINFKESIQRQFQDRDTHSESIRSNIQHQLDQINAHITENAHQYITQQNTNNNINKICQQNIETNTKELQKIKSEFGTHLHEIHQLSQSIAMFNSQINDLSEKQLNNESQNQKSKKIQGYMKEVLNEFKKLECRVDFNQPILTEAQIASYLYQILPKKYHEKVAVAHSNKSSQFQEQISQYESHKQHSNKQGQKIKRQLKSLKDSIISQTHQTTTHIITKMRNKWLQQKQLNINDYSQEAKIQYWKQIDLSELLIEAPLQQQKSTQIFKQQQSQKQTLSIDLQNIYQTLQQQQKEYNLQKQTYTNYIRTVQEQMQHEHIQFQSELEKVGSKITESKIEGFLQFKELKQQLQNANSKQNQMVDGIEKNQRICALLYQFNYMFNVMIRQDESDRRSVALMGVSKSTIKQFNNTTKAPISIDNQCFSCSGQPAFIVNAFKLACLSYQPSDVVIDQGTYTRMQMFKVLEGFLAQIKEIFQKQTIQPSPQIINSKKQTNKNYRIQHTNLQSNNNIQKQLIKQQSIKQSMKQPTKQVSMDSFHSRNKVSSSTSKVRYSHSRFNCRNRGYDQVHQLSNIQ